jgi:hypothetical protein
MHFKFHFVDLKIKYNSVRAEIIQMIEDTEYVCSSGLHIH